VDEIIFVVEESPEGGYSARALGASIFTEADDLETLQVEMRDAVLCHFDDDARLPPLVNSETLPAFWAASHDDYERSFS